MITGALTVTTAPATWRSFRLAVPALLLGLGLLGLLFREEIEAAVRVWMHSTAYNHCILVLPIAAYLAWDRRSLLADVLVQPTPLLALAGLPLALVWLIAERVGIMEGRQLAAMCLVELLFLTVLGWPMWRRLSAPLLYLFFLVPFGAFIVPALQTFTAGFTIVGLNLLGIPNFSDGYTIEIPAGTFYVAEACAGLRFLIAAIAFGVLYSCLMYRSPLRRGLFMAASVIVPIIANGFRALGIVVLGQALGSAEAAAADHIIYGWVFFSAVIFLLILIGLPFRQEPHWRAPPVAAQRPNKAPFAGSLLAAAVLGLSAMIGPVTAGRLDDGANGTLALAQLDFGAEAPCTSAPAAKRTEAGAPANAAPSRILVQRLTCGDQNVTLHVEVFAPRTGLSHIVAQRRRLTGEFGGDADTTLLQSSGVEWQLVETETPLGATATALWIDGRPATGSLATRIRQARNSLLGSTRAPVLVAITPEIAWKTEGEAGRLHAKALLQAFLDSQPALPAKIGALSLSVLDTPNALH